MRKVIGFISGLLGKLILLGLAVLLAGVLYVGAYFYVKSGEPMTVAESQRLAPGLTFRDFWASRVEQAQAWDKKLIRAGGNGGCEGVMTGITIYRTLIATPFVLQARAHQDDPKYDRQARIDNNNAVPPAEVLYNAPLLDAAWATFEEWSWWQYAYKPNQSFDCATTYPTPADVSANHTQETGTMP